VGESAGAVAIGGHGLIVDVVHWDIVLVALFVEACLFFFPSREAFGSWSRGKRGERTEWSQARIREAREVDVEEYACAICVTGAGNVATHAAAGAVGQGRGVCHAGWVFLDDGSVTECASGACGGGEREGRSEGEDGRGMHLVGAWTN